MTVAVDRRGRRAPVTWRCVVNRVAGDPVTEAVLVLAALVVPARIWTLATMAGAGQYAVYPGWVQAWVAAVFAGQAAAELVGGLPLRRKAAAHALVAALASALLLIAGDPYSGAWVLWVNVTVIECLIFYRLSLVHHAREG